MYYRSLYPTRKPADLDQYVRALKENLAQPGRFAAVVGLSDASREPSEQALRQAHLPTLILMGTKDSDFPDPAAEARILAEQTGGRFQLIEGAGHCPQTEMPEETAPIIIDFLQSAAPSG